MYWIAKPLYLPLQIFAFTKIKITFCKTLTKTGDSQADWRLPSPPIVEKKTCAFSYCSRVVVVAVDIVEDDAEDGAKNAAEDDAEDDDDDDDVDDDDVDDDDVDDDDVGDDDVDDDDVDDVDDDVDDEGGGEGGHAQRKI